MKNYLSLFNGISAGRLAADRAGLAFDTYYIAEIDKYANRVSEYRYPDNIQLGDVNNWREWDIDWSNVGLVTAGFPCQSWSLAGKQLGDKDERGKLFWVMLDIIKHAKQHNPDVKFMLENVKMKKEFEQYLTYHTEQALGEVNKTLINSALVSAQSRKRYYWTNFPVTQPDDKGLLLVDIIDDISPTLTTNKGEGIKITCGALRGRYLIDGKRQDGKMLTAGKTTQRLELRNDCKTNTLTTVQKDNVVVRQKSKTVRSSGRNSYDRHEWDSISDCHYRKLTTTECARLQTFPDGWCEDVVSNAQSYKAYGNAWTVDVIAHIFGCMVG